MKRFSVSVASVALLFTGCLQSNVHGANNGSPGATGGTGGATGSPSTNGAQASGSGSGAGMGETGGSAQGSGGSSASSGGNTGGEGSTTGMGGTTGHRGTGGTSSGGRRSDAGPCLGNDQVCLSGDDCCSGSCEEGCRQGFGQECFEDLDCSSGNCVKGQCGCGVAQPNYFAGFGTDADCCGPPCTQFSFPKDQGGLEGLCCQDVGGPCSSPIDCCDKSCSNGQCQCIPSGTSSQGLPQECCSGLSANDYCVNGPGGPCSAPLDCSTANCDNGTCGSCDGQLAACTSSNDCCTGLACAAAVAVENGMLIDGGGFCCQPEGDVCANSGSETCCGYCDAGVCACAGPGKACYYNLGCCAGGACLPGVGGSDLTCCQKNGETCFSVYECCSSYCGADQKCACTPDGGPCGTNAGGYGAATCCSGVCGSSNRCL